MSCWDEQEGGSQPWVGSGGRVEAGGIAKQAQEAPESRAGSTLREVTKLRGIERRVEVEGAVAACQRAVGQSRGGSFPMGQASGEALLQDQYYIFYKKSLNKNIYRNEMEKVEVIVIGFLNK